MAAETKISILKVFYQIQMRKFSIIQIEDVLSDSEAEIHKHAY